MGLFGRLFKKEAKKKKHPYCAAVVAAAGCSSRMNGEDKLFAEINEVPVIAHTLCALQSCEEIDEIVVSTKSESISIIGNLCREYGITKATKVVVGGNTRLESVYNGVMEVSKMASFIAVHDAARPLVPNEVIKKAIEKAIEVNAAAPAVPVKDTIKTVEDGKVVGTPDRKKLFAFQTPQVFRAELLKGALVSALEKKLDVTDDCMAVEMMGVHVYVTEGSDENIKITTPADLTFARALFEIRQAD